MRAGLDQLLPHQNVYIDALGGWSSLGGPFIRGEAGALLGRHTAAFLFGQADNNGQSAGAGVRVTF